MSIIHNKLSLIFFLNIFTIFHSQTILENLVFELPIEPILKNNNGKIIEIYKLRLEKCDDSQIEYKINDDNTLNKIIKIKTNNSPLFIFEYERNNRYQKENEIKNIISYKELLNSNSKNLEEILTRTKYLYILDKNKKIKKVNFRIIESL